VSDGGREGRAVTDRDGPAVSSPRSIWLRLEGGAALTAALILYAGTEEGWLLFALLLLVPDLSMLAYLIGPAAGRRVYNAVHTYVGPVLLGVLGPILWGSTFPASVALIWGAHVAGDRLLGFGLKTTDDFRDTHLGRIGD